MARIYLIFSLYSLLLVLEVVFSSPSGTRDTTDGEAVAPLYTDLEDWDGEFSIADADKDDADLGLTELAATRSTEASGSSKSSSRPTRATTKKQCRNLIPGIRRLARGIDITSLDLTPNTFQASNGFRRMVLDYSCEEDKNWNHPAFPNQTYDQPDQLSGIDSRPAGSQSNKITFANDLKESKDAMGVSAGFEVDTNTYGAFSASGSYRKAQEQLLVSNRTVAETSAEVSSVQLDLNPPGLLTLHPSLIRQITALSGKRYTQAWKEYDQFVKHYGTHYYENAILGGHLLQKTTLQNDYALGGVQQDIKSNLSYSFKDAFKASLDTENTNSEKTESYNSASKSEFFHYGGRTDSPKLGKNFNLATWTATVYAEPWLLGGKLVPLEELIKEKDATVAQELTKAIKVRRLRAYLVELKNSIKLSSIVLDGQTEALLSEVSTTLRSPGQIEQFDQLIANLDLIYGKVEQIRDRALIKEYARKLDTSLNGLGGCKLISASTCPKDEEYHLIEELQEQQNEARTKVLAKLRTLSAQQSDQVITHVEAQAVIKSAAVSLVRLETPSGYCGQWKESMRWCKNCIKNNIPDLHTIAGGKWTLCKSGKGLKLVQGLMT